MSSEAKFAGIANQIKEAAEARAAEKEGVVADALRSLEALHADLRVHLEHPRTLARLKGTAPPLQLAVVNIITALWYSAGERAIVVSGVRGDKEQQELYLQGRGRPGKIVTHLDGVKKRSRHQVAVDGPWKGLGCAVDLCFLDADGKPTWDEAMPWALLGSLAKAHGLVWGGDWPKLRDKPHVELFES
ncbi:MAG TPA: M15 family metallopeptidase [Polyangiaceae bacterium]